jgi:hypothetical protein
MLRSGVALVRAMMRSASSDKIRPIEWWSRARTALETGAQSSDHFSGMVASMGRKLQIDVTTATTAEDLAFLAEDVADDFEAFRRFCAEEALYIVAIAQTENKARKNAAEVARRADAGEPVGDLIKEA